MVDYITESFGFDSLVDLVKQYAFIKEEDEMFQEVFDQDLDTFNDGFIDWIVGRVEEINVYVHKEDSPDEGDGHGHGIRENSSAVLAELYNNASLKQHMRSRIEEEPRDFQAHLQLGIVLFKEENFEEARHHLEEAHEILPSYAGYPSPPLVLSQIYEKEGNRTAQLEQLKILLDNQQHDYGSAMILAEAAVGDGDIESARYYLDRALQIDPYRIDVHQLKASYADLIDDTSLAVTEYEVLAKLDITDPVEAQTNLAQAYLNDGRFDEARRNILNALEIAPSYQRAQQILLQSVDNAN